MNLNSDTNLEHKNPIFTPNPPAALHLVAKKISSSVDMVETAMFDYIRLHCDLDLENSNSIFLHDTLTNDAASLYQV